MPKLIADMSMSLDGRVAKADDDASRLHRWFFDGETAVAPGAPFRTSAASAALLRDLGSVGAIIGGRRYFDSAFTARSPRPARRPATGTTASPPPTPCGNASTPACSTSSRST